MKRSRLKIHAAICQVRVVQYLHFVQQKYPGFWHLVGMLLAKQCTTIYSRHELLRLQTTTTSTNIPHFSLLLLSSQKSSYQQRSIETTIATTATTTRQGANFTNGYRPKAFTAPPRGCNNNMSYTYTAPHSTLMLLYASSSLLELKELQLSQLTAEKKTRIFAWLRGKLLYIFHWFLSFSVRMKLDITIYVLNIHRLFMHNTFQMLERLLIKWAPQKS